MITFEWDSTREQAAMLIAVGDLTNDEIAERLDIGVATLYRWKTSQEFKDRVKEIKETLRQEILDTSIGDIVKRIQRSNKRWMAIDKLISARASDPAMYGVPGGDTGLLAHDQKAVGSGPTQSIVDVYTFDAALIKEERELQKQTAQELGQWTDRQKVDLNGEVKNMSLEERQAEIERILDAIKAKQAE